MKLSSTRLKHLTLSLTCLAFALASLALNFRTASAVPPSDAPYLFADATVEGDPTPDDPTVVRTRLVRVNWTPIRDRVAQELASSATGSGERPAPAEPGSAPLRLNLYPDVTLTAVLDRVETKERGGYAWIGHLEGMEEGQVILAVEGEVMAGNVALPGAFYQVRYVGAGLHAVREIDQSAFPLEADPIPVDLPAAPSVRALDVSTADDGSLVDVMVAYTGATRQAVGGVTAMNALISLAVSETNAGYVNSEVTQRIRLVHTAELAYDESDFDWLETLHLLQGTTDGSMDDVHALRDAYAADLVVLLVSQPYSSYCGIGYLMSTPSSFFEAWAFSVVARQCATGYYSFAHEMGHNMGCHHDHLHAGSSGAYPYSYGYQAPDGDFRTVMAYNCTGGCPRINHWSNPGVTYGGQPTGVSHTAPDAADNHLSLNNTAYTVANWRSSPSGPPPAPSNLGATPTLQTQIYLSWVDNSVNENGFRIERSPNGTGGWVQIAAVGADVTSHADAGLSKETTYYYRVCAHNPSGDSAYSNTDQATTPSDSVYVPLVLGNHP